MTDTSSVEFAHAIANMLEYLRREHGLAETDPLACAVEADLEELVPDRPLPHEYRIGQFVVIVVHDTTYTGLSGWIAAVHGDPENREWVVKIPGVVHDEHTDILQPATVPYADHEIAPHPFMPDVRVDTEKS